ncbi:hypothetical protein VitviT2T_004133 [Vitis vinifera]|uniref:TIR domain-containing protein n=2 Tax=Vitis vinifera TaxID=29760 RepID=A0ABY9BPS1_VITVI|nr:hypothetical protein VitviT2T_004133 [Vitis vinifera]
MGSSVHGRVWLMWLNVACFRDCSYCPRGILTLSQALSLLPGLLNIDDGEAPSIKLVCATQHFLLLILLSPGGEFAVVARLPTVFFRWLGAIQSYLPLPYQMSGFWKVWSSLSVTESVKFPQTAPMLRPCVPMIHVAAKWTHAFNQDGVLVQSSLQKVSGQGVWTHPPMVFSAMGDFLACHDASRWWQSHHHPTGGCQRSWEASRLSELVGDDLPSFLSFRFAGGGIASSSFTPSIPQTSTYDVFLSFRGEDTRYNFTDHLYKALGRRGIRTFRDDKLRRGEAIAPELLKAIEESRSSVIVFSENYARSRWCLDELVKIMECQKDLGHTVIPIFYHVDPSHVRKQEGSFGEAFAGYEENWKDKIPRWRTALTEAANLSGWHLQDGYESNQIKAIIDSIFHQLKCKRLDVGANLVGIDSHVKEMILRLHMESRDVSIVGISGVGGIGKTTIAKVIYNKLSCKFECMSFLENIREIFNAQGLSHLQNQLLGDILEGEGSQNINSVAHRASIIKDILSSKRVFIVLDDVDDPSQLEYLLGHREWLGEGSRVIITTRNKHVLAVQEVDDIYEVKGLNFKEARELFSLYAFKQELPKSDYRNISCRVVSYCQGLPLALKVLGSLLFKKTIPQWESELNKLDREPEMKIHNVLKRSYDGLDRTEKNIFLDVACFFKGEDRDFVSRILDGCDFHAERGIRNLNDLCLITLPYNQIRMHDLIQQMGWEIVREKFPDEPNQWSRLWDPHDIQQALRTSKEIQKAQTISLDLSKLKRVCFNSNVFAKMTSLRLLKVHSGVYYHHFGCIHEKDYYAIIKNTSKMRLDMKFEFPYELRYLYWDGYPLDFLPSNFDGEKLVELHLKCSNIKQLWQGHKYLERLKVIDLSYSRKLIQMSEFSSMPNLERLILKGCVSLIDIHPSVGNMKKLTTLSLRFCDKLKNLPDSIGDLESLEILDLSYCSKFEKFLEKGGNMKSLKKLRLRNSAIKDLPDSIGDLESLELLDLSNCSKFEKFPEKGGNMKSLMELDLKNTAIKDLPDSIGDLESLEILNLSNSKFEKFSEKGRNMKSLMELDSNQLCNLQKLNISQSKMAGQIPVLSLSLKRNRRTPLHKQGRFIRSALALPPQLVEIHNRGVEMLETQCSYSRK